ncbi:MAG TPA: SRPBCC domain-containing protein [Solirubrobacteraceae bacterium]
MAADRIERETVIEAPVEVVWRVVTEEQHINRWFTDAAELDLRPHGDGLFTWDQRAAVQRDEPMTVRLRVERVERPHAFSFRWGHPEGAEPQEHNSTLVEFTLMAEGERTRLRVVESGIDALELAEERRTGFREDHSTGWQRHIAELAEYAPSVSAVPQR